MCLPWRHGCWIAGSLLLLALPLGPAGDPAADALAEAPAVAPETMPMEPPPPPRRAPGAPEDETRIVTFDQATGHVEVRTVPGLRGLLETYTKAGVSVDQLLEDPEAVAKNFSAWAEVADPAAGNYPRRVKLIGHYGFVLSECSGTLIDPMHVITAGHCAYSHDRGAYPDSIEVVPGYESWQRPFGTALAAQIHCWTLWIDDHDYDHDIAVLDLNQPIGALAGWWGYGYDTGCDSWESGIWTHAGWPAEDPYTGLLMYENAGSFDDCSQDGWDNRASWDAGSYGGTSGSGALKTTTGAVYAVLSTSDRSSVTVDCKLTETKFGQIGAMIAEDTPAELDLLVMDANGPEAVESGSRLAWLNFVAFNYSSATAGGTWTYRTYLSDDASWSMDDIDMGPATFDHTFTPVSGLRVTAAVPPLVPPETPAGAYHVLVSIVHPDWYNPNNTTTGWHTFEVDVTCPPAWAPALRAPLDGQTCVDPEAVSFRWDPVLPYADYQLRVGTVCGEGTIVDTPLTDHSWYGLAPGTTYYWSVRTKARCGNWGAWSACRSFRTRPDPAEVCAAVSPADGAICRPTSLTLSWTPYPDAATYDLQYSPAWCYEGTLVTGITGTSRALTGLAASTTYYWRVRAHTICGQTTDWSSVPGFCFTFKTAPAVLAAPTRIGPGDGTTCNSSLTHLLWSHVEDWDHYEVKVSTAPSGGTVYVTTSNGYTPPGLQSGVVYYWQVRAFNQCGMISPWTSWWSFSLDLEPPTNPTSLTSSSHAPGVWSTTDNTVDAAWNWGYDNCAGSFPQYATLWDRSPTTAPTAVTVYGELTFETSPALPDGKDHWFHVRTVDYADNYAAETLHLGPFWIDLSPPTVPGLDYVTIDAGQTMGPTQISVDWLASSDDASGIAGYSYVLSGGATPPTTLDNIVETTDLTHTRSVGKSGTNYFHVRGVNGATLGGGVLTHGPLTIDPSLFGLYFAAPLGGEVLVEGTTYNIRWELYDSGPPVAASGRLQYSLDGGASYLPIDLALTPALITGERYIWTVPLASSEEAVLRLQVTDTAGHVVYVRSRRFTLQQVTSVPERPAPGGLLLEAARPNPFNPRTTIGFALPEDGRVRLAVYDMGGKLVRVLLDGADLPAGRHEAEWDGRDDRGVVAAAGVYLYRLEAGQRREARRMVLVK